ncbi:MAG: hypothetical protein KDA05_06825 [Phycisphaerales bacterium]|nr:hypothetical protein [Phycisphaerales bacterium]MCB9840394.1 hypothetical protein [Phycisphaeraceae bacterium]
MGRRTQQRRRRRVEELLALRHDDAELRRRWLARVDAWAKGLAETGPCLGADGEPTPRALGVIESVLGELAQIGESMDGELAIETRRRLEAACRAGGSVAGKSDTQGRASESHNHTEIVVKRSDVAATNRSNDHAA